MPDLGRWQGLLGVAAILGLRCATLSTVFAGPTVVTGTTAAAIATATPIASRSTVTAIFARSTLAALATVVDGQILVALADRREADLALVVDVVDTNFDFVAQLQNVFDVVDALALTELRNVNEAVTSGKDVDECTELRDRHDTTLVDRAEVGRRRLDDVHDALTCIVHLQ